MGKSDDLKLKMAAFWYKKSAADYYHSGLL